MNLRGKLNWILFWGMIVTALIFSVGCIAITTPNPDVDYDDYIVSYIRVSPSSATMKVNTSKTFTVLAYDAEDNLIPVDPSEVNWVASYECIACGKVWELKPNSGSINTSFTPKVTGKFYVWAQYKEKWAKSLVQAEE